MNLVQGFLTVFANTVDNMTLNRIWKWNNIEEKFALVEDEDKVCISDLERIETSLLKTVKKRCLVFLLCKNTVGSVVGYVSFANNSIVPLLLNANMDADLLRNLIRTYKPDYLWVPSSQVQQFPKYESKFSIYDYTLLKTEYEDAYELHDNLALLLTTSGSTGSPKFVRQSYDNVISNAQAIVKYLKLDSSEKPITTLPMNYTYGLSVINSHLMVGASILLTDKTMMQKEFWQFFKEQGATSIAGVPYTYEMLDKLRFYRMELPSLKTMTQAGGKLHPDLHEKFARYAAENNKNFVVMYGQCEATARMGYLPAERALEKKGSMGIAIPGGSFRLIDEDNKEITTSFTPGELVYEGKNVTMGYAECGEDLAKGDERHGVLLTGDIAHFDEDGFYYIVGRKKRFLKIYGNRVNLDEMDRLIKGKYNVEVACAGIDDHLYIFLTSDDKAEEIRTYAYTKTGLNPIAFKYIIIDEIPKNDAGKTLYNELKQYYDEKP